ncbi:redoxin domain-containing protein [Colwellia sp. 12G3]|uniref:redoxin domain-containing protein n=1 Tax=Colwellia sp. 12G3 TaxID=2058299 RepID=UPI000C33B638|nr:redoxin domain-containing protein [Colwellia sp. 12G3]PKI16674.1 hypothetical protein CXF71_08750 [Colwellia sp. 12G3]
MNKFSMSTLALLLCVSITAVDAADLNITEWEQSRFNELDTHNDGSLDQDEFRGTTKDWMTKAGYSEDKQVKQTNKKFRQYDSNNDGKVSLEEFVNATRQSKAAKSADSKAPKNTEQVAKPQENKKSNSGSKSNAKLTLGDIAPNYLGTDREGNEVNVDELKGKIVIASFWVSWCKHCKNELSILQNLQDQVGSDLLKVVAINYKESHQSYTKLKKQLSALKLTLTHDKRGKIGKNYGVEKAPNLFIIGKDGNVIFMDSEYQKTPVNAIVDVLKKELST